MDLLNANDRRESEMNGLSDQEQYFETRNTNNMNSYNRASTGFHKLSSSGRRDPLETTHVSIHVISSNLARIQTSYQNSIVIFFSYLVE